jgi:hypothetical protein
MLGRIVCPDKPHLTFIGLGESVASLFAHSLDLSYLPNCFLKLLHPATVSSNIMDYEEPWSVIGDIEFLYFLDVMVLLREVHPSGTAR